VPDPEAQSGLRGGKGSLRNRLLAVVAVSSLGSVLLTGLLLASFYSLTARREALSELSRQADVLADEVARVARQGEDLRPGNLGAARRIPLRAVLNSGRLDYVGLWYREPGGDPQELVGSGDAGPSAEGADEIFAKTTRTRQRGPQPQARPRPASGDMKTAAGRDVLSAAQVVPGSDGRLVVIVARRLALPSFRVLLRLVIAALVGLALSAGLAYWLSRRILAPVAEMERTALAIASGDYSARVDPPKDRELARLADAMNSMASEVEAARRREQALLMTISHDLRTPLTSIRAYAEGISDGTIEGRDEVGRAAGVIASEAGRLSRLVDVLFDAARLGSGQFALDISRVDLAEVVDDVASVFASRAERSGIELVVASAGPAVTETDGDRVAQIVSNLLDNALKNTPAGGRIEVGVEEVEGASPKKFRLWVSDNGRGIPQKDLPRIFEPGFTSGLKTQGGPGLGLGLAIVSAIVSALGGSIDARSDEGKGTTISIYIS
jgi:signal transduction histidine kinase